MNKIKVVLVSLVMVWGLQLTAQDTMYVYRNEEIIAKMAIADIDSMNFVAASLPERLTDIDGNTYATITIGTQTWMAENLRTTHYNDGIIITNPANSEDWSITALGAWCWYNDNATDFSKYGAMYNHIAVNTGKLCPEGWHVPTDDEWSTLIDYLKQSGHNYNGGTGGEAVAKSLADSTGWGVSTESGAVGNTDYPAYRNKSGFTAMPSGFRYSSGNFGLAGFGAYWWTSTPDGDNAWCRSIYYSLSYTSRNAYSKNAGAAVRCLED